MSKCPICSIGESMGMFYDGVKEPCDSCLLEMDKEFNPHLYDENGNYVPQQK